MRGLRQLGLPLMERQYRALNQLPGAMYPEVPFTEFLSRRIF